MAHTNTHVDSIRGIDAVLEALDDGGYDMQIGDDGDILTADAFDTAIIVSLFTDARAGQSQVQVAEQRRGWIGNESFGDDFEIGSLLWLWYQQRLTQSTVNGIEDAASNALQWFVEDSIPATGTRIADAVSVVGSVVSQGILLEITMDRPSSRVAKRYFELWDKTGGGLTSGS
jgi:phage gp46-like protein